MKIILLKTKVEFYSSIEDLPIKRYQRFNKFLMIDCEVGNDFKDYQSRTRKTIEFLKKEMNNEALIELQNRNQAVLNAYNEYSPKQRALAVMVKRIGSKEYKDFDPESLNEIIDKLEKLGYTQKQLENNISELKKKIENQVQAYFPTYFNKRKELNSSINIISRLKAVLECIIEGGDTNSDKGIFDAEKDILYLNKPNSWNVYTHGNAEIKAEVGFEKFALQVSEHTREDINLISVFRFYSLLEFIKEKNTENGRRNNKL